MGVWSSIILILAMSGVFGFGFHLMTKLDKFLDVNRKAIEKENESREPSCVMLANSLTDEEILEEIRMFRKHHEDINVLLYDSHHTELMNSMTYRTLQK